MIRLLSRAGRWPLAFIFGTLATLGACTDNDQSLTAPVARATTPHLAVGDIITVTTSKGTADVGTLRWAVAQATGGEIIRFDPRLAGATITLDSTLVIRNYVTIEGPVDKGITISAGGRGRVIDLPPASDIFLPPTTFRNVSITGGKLATEGGAGIRASASIALEHSTVFGNEAVAAPAIMAIYYAAIKIVNSTVSGNTSTGYGYPAVSIGESGAEITNSTIAYNSMGGIAVSLFANATIRNSIIANNGFTNCLYSDNISYQGTNLANDMSCGDETVMLIGDPKLSPLANNGGPSMTHAIAPESPAFNGIAGPCTVSVDQRYKPRDGYCDIGAFESTDSTTATVTIDRVATVILAGANAAVTGTVKCNRAGDQFSVLVQVQQKGADKTIVSGSGTVNVTCNTVAQPWSAVVVPSGGLFKSGGATATAATQQTPSWVVPDETSRSIKLL